jgi:hypothetical protein
MDSAHSNISKLVSLTFDENPEVRKQAAKSLGEVTDPAASFALVELSFDKDPTVRAAAQQYLDKRKHAEPELMSFANIFSSGKAKEEHVEGEAHQHDDAREKVLRPITQIFEKGLGKEKADVLKSKMMPSIEKIYLKSHPHGGGKKKNEEDGRKAVQEFLTSYLEAISDIEQIGSGMPQPADAIGISEPPPKEPLPEPEPGEPSPPEMESRSGLGELEEVGKQGQMTGMSSEIAGIELQEVAEAREVEEIKQLPGTFFKKAYETMMLSEGDEGVMKQEMNRMIDSARREIGLAFRLAKKRFKEINITNLTKIKDGMRNINTELLTVRNVESGSYQKTKKVAGMLVRVFVNDDTGNEGVIYLFDGRGSEIKSGMRVKVVLGQAKTFEATGETALVLGKKGNVYIVL